MYGWTIHYEDPIFGISLVFLIKTIPSPWHPADGFAMNIPPLLIYFYKASLSYGRR